MTFHDTSNPTLATPDPDPASRGCPELAERADPNDGALWLWAPDRGPGR